MERTPEKPFWNPYVAGIALGIVLLSAFVLMGRGLGASGALYRSGVAAASVVAPEHVLQNTMMGSVVEGGAAPLDSYFVLLAFGVFLGGLVSSFAGGRFKAGVVKGPRISLPSRMALALTGGIIMGWAARMSRGCTSGQALSGGALLSVGSWIFMLSVFAGGYALAYFVRRQWT